MPKQSLQSTLISVAMDNLPTGAFICDTEGIIRFINAAYAKYLGLHPEDALGRHITELIPTSGIPAVLQSRQVELRQLRRLPNGATLIVNRVPLFDKQGEFIGVLSMTLFDTADQVQDLLNHVSSLDNTINSFQRRIKSALASPYTIESIVGSSHSIMEFKKFLLRYAATDAAVLIQGETGSGKELAAGAIHTASARAEGPFVGINCAAIPRELFESEVFGYAAGAFSGARREGSVGKIEVAHKGTLFLDEVGDLPLQIQAKLLRVLEEKRIVRLGSSRPRDVDFRLVAATNRDLKAMIAAGTFREDLYYRINGMRLNMPPLRERREDIPLLIQHFLSHISEHVVACDDAAMQALVAYSWPGNIRELRNVVGRALSLCRDGRITTADLPPELSHPSLRMTMSPKGQLRAMAQKTEAHILHMTLCAHNWNVAATARALGISRAGLYAKMRCLGIRRHQKL